MYMATKDAGLRSSVAWKIAAKGYNKTRINMANYASIRNYLQLTRLITMNH